MRALRLVVLASLSLSSLACSGRTADGGGDLGGLVDDETGGDGDGAPLDMLADETETETGDPVPLDMPSDDDGFCCEGDIADTRTDLWPSLCWPAPGPDSCACDHYWCPSATGRPACDG